MPLITDDALLVQRRAVLNDHDLLKRIGSHGKKDAALVMTASFMVGSFRWKDHDTDLANWLRGDIPLNIDGTLNCNQLLACAAYFCGVTKDTLNKPHYEIDLAQMMKDRGMMESGKIPMASMKRESQFVSNFFGLYDQASLSPGVKKVRPDYLAFLSLIEIVTSRFSVS